MSHKPIPGQMLVDICIAAGIDPEQVSEIHLTPTFATFTWRHPVQYVVEVTP
jgi:hypothetical protein